MQFTLEIGFLGLMMFVPVDDAGRQVEPSRAAAVWVLAVDGKKPTGVNGLGKPIDKHRSAVRFDDANLRSAPRSWQRQVTNAEQNRSWFYLEHSDLTLQGGAGSNPSPLAVNPDDYALLPSLREIEPTAVTPPSRWSAPLVNQPVILRLKLDSGSLGLSGPVNRSEVVEFKPAGAWPGRPIATRMSLRINGLEDSVTLKTTAGDLVLGPDRNCVGGCTVRIEVLNSPDHVFLPNHNGHHDANNRHFELFWNLVEDPPAERPAPVVPKPPTGLVVAANSDLLCPEVRP
jgi:hypothetical protein